MEILSDSFSNLFKGEYGRVGAFERQRPYALIFKNKKLRYFRPFDQKNPYLATITVVRELHTDSSGRSCGHLEFKVDNTRVRYEAGDHVGIFPKNNSVLVERIALLLNADLETVFKLINLDGTN